MNGYYLKHIFRTVKKKPLQPLLLVVVLCLAFVAMNVILTSTKAFDVEQSRINFNKYGNSEIMISTDTGSKSRFLFREDVLESCPDAEVVGTYNVPFVSNGQCKLGFATDFENFGDIFTVEFLEYAPFSVSERDQVVFVSSTFSKETGIKIGDSITLTMFSHDVEYRVCGISKTNFLNQGHVLVDITGLVKVLAKDNVFLSIIKDDFKPYGTLYIHVPSDVSGALEILKNEFSDYKVELSNQGTTSILQQSFQVMSVCMVIIGMLLAFAVAYACSFCLTKERAEDAMLFSYAGYSQNKLTVYRHLELLVYGVIGIVLGFFISFPLGTLSFETIGFKYVTYSPSAFGLTISSVAIIVVTQITCFVFDRKTSIKPKKNGLNKIVFVAPVLAVGVFVGLFFTPFLSRFTVFIIGALLIFFNVTIFFPPIFKAWSKKSSDRVKSVSARLARRNVMAIDAMSNTARLLLILLSAICVLLFLLWASSNYVDSLGKWLNTDFMIVGGTERTSEILSTVDDVDCYSFTVKQGEIDGNEIVFWSVNDSCVFADFCNSDRTPTGNNVIGTKNYLSRYGLKEGDTFKVTFGAIECEFYVEEVTAGENFYLLFDSEYLGMKPDMYMVGSKTLTRTEVYDKISKAFAMETVGILETDFLFEEQLNNQITYLYFGQYLFIFLSIFGLIGLLDTMIDSYRSRKEEFTLFSVGGMSKRQIRKMIFTECGFSLLVVLGCMLVIVPILLIETQLGLLTYGCDCWYSIVYLAT